MRRVAAFDCGTNTIKLLVADLDPSTGQQHELWRTMRMVRLGQDVDRTGRIAPEALLRVFAAIEEFTAELTRFEVEAMRFCATSAARDAENAQEFADGVRSRLGITPEVVSGEEEARLSFLGATRTFPAQGHTLVVDIGGGSTEAILGDGAALTGHSLDIGSVRMTERWLAHDPPSSQEWQAARDDIGHALDSLAGHGVELAAAQQVIGVAGTITTLAAMHLDLPAYDRALINRSVIPRHRPAELADELARMTVARRRELPFMHPGRADVIAAGALIFAELVARTNVAEVKVSESDILDGIAWSMAERD